MILALVGWFAWQAWSLRDVWANVYTLHDAATERSRSRPGGLYARADPGFNQRQLWDNALSKPLPPLARYLLAEALTAEAASADPRAYGLAVAQERRLARLAPAPADPADGVRRGARPARPPRVPHHALAQPRPRHGPLGDLRPRRRFRRRRRARPPRSATTPENDGPDRGLAVELVSALDATRFQDRFKALDAATLWLRTHHPEAGPALGRLAGRGRPDRPRGTTGPGIASIDRPAVRGGLPRAPFDKCSFTAHPTERNGTHAFRSDLARSGGRVTGRRGVGRRSRRWPGPAVEGRRGRRPTTIERAKEKERASGVIVKVDRRKADGSPSAKASVRGRRQRGLPGDDQHQRRLARLGRATRP